MRQFLDEKREEDLKGPKPVSDNDSCKKLRKVWKMCEISNRLNRGDTVAYFKQVCFVGCVRAGITRLDKNLVGVFDLRCVVITYCR